MTLHDQARDAMLADLERLRRSLWALARRYQLQIDAFLIAGQPVPAPPPALAGRVRASGGIVEFINPDDAALPA